MDWDQIFFEQPLLDYKSSSRLVALEHKIGVFRALPRWYIASQKLLDLKSWHTFCHLTMENGEEEDTETWAKVREMMIVTRTNGILK